MCGVSSLGRRVHSGVPRERRLRPTLVALRPLALRFGSFGLASYMEFITSSRTPPVQGYGAGHRHEEFLTVVRPLSPSSTSAASGRAIGSQQRSCHRSEASLVLMSGAGVLGLMSSFAVWSCCLPTRTQAGSLGRNGRPLLPPSILQRSPGTSPRPLLALPLVAIAGAVWTSPASTPSGAANSRTSSTSDVVWRPRSSSLAPPAGVHSGPTPSTSSSADVSRGFKRKRQEERQATLVAA